MPDSRTSIESLLASKGSPPATGPASRESEACGEDDYQAFSYGRVGRHAQMMVAFVKCSGEVEAFPYSMLSRLHSENPEFGCRLWFGATAVTIEGEGLTRLVQFLREHRVREVREADHGNRFRVGGDGLVTRLLVDSNRPLPRA